MAVGESFDVALPFCRPKTLRREVFDIAVMGRLASGLDARARVGASRRAEHRNLRGDRPDRIRHHVDRAVQALPPRRVSGGRRRQLAPHAVRRAAAVAARDDRPRAPDRVREPRQSDARARDRRASTKSPCAWRSARRASTLVRQFLAESGLLAASGAALGIGLAQILSRVLVRALSTDGRLPDPDARHRLAGAALHGRRRHRRPASSSASRPRSVPRASCPRRR